jgi:alpha-maltose-1-phosphate synthase
VHCIVRLERLRLCLAEASLECAPELRVLTVSHFFESHGGGIERVAGQLCRQFVTLDATAAWAASDADDPPACPIDPVPLACINPTEKLTGLPMPIPGLGAARTLLQQVRRSDVVVIHDALYVTSILALLMAKAQGQRTILIQHIGTIPFSSRILRAVMSAANVFVTRPMLWAADERVFISDTVRHDLLGRTPRRASELLFNGVDGAIFHPMEGHPVEPDALAGIVARAPQRRVLFVGRYVEKKGLRVLRALAALRPDLSFFLVGNGPIRVCEWGLANVHDLGLQTPGSLADLYRWADLLILPSVGEGYPLVIQEAMACGLPVVCGAPTDRADPDAAKWLRGVNIDLSKREASAQRCADAIDAFKLSTEDRAEMAHYARRRYDWRAMAQRLIALARSPQASAPRVRTGGL